MVGNATCFPVTMARGATWDIDLEERIGEAIGRELRAVGADLYGGVCVNVLRHPAWGRAQETYGEDPHHLGELGAALTRGAQRHVMATVKHFACNSMENARFIVDVTVDEVALHEVFLPHFKRIVDEGVACVMSAYNAVNGEWCGQSPTLLTDILRDEWGFEGFVISDWIFGLRDAGPSITAGLDVEMPARMVRRDGLPAALAAGEVTAADIDACVTRTVTAMLRHAADPGRDSSPLGPDVLASPAHQALAREAAAKAVVLLRNAPVDGVPVLPLDPAARRVAVLGELADVRNLGDGGSSDVYAPSVVTILDGLRAALPARRGRPRRRVGPRRGGGAGHGRRPRRRRRRLHPGRRGRVHRRQRARPTSSPCSRDPTSPRWSRPSRRDSRTTPVLVEGSVPGSDALGFSNGGDREQLTLHDADEALIDAVAAANARTVVCLVAGSAVLTETWRHRVPAVAQVWYSGMQGGHGIADVLTGAVDATGRLPFTVPTDADHLPPFDRDADAVTYDALARLLAPGPRPPRARVPVRLRAVVHVVAARPDHARRGRATTSSSAPSSPTPATATAPTWCRSTPAVPPTRPARPGDWWPSPGSRWPPEPQPTSSCASRGRRLAVRDPETHAWTVPAGTYVLTVGRHSADLDAVDLVIDRP